MFKGDHFDHDMMIFNDLCAAYKGDIVILREPEDFIPVKETQVMKKLLTPKLKQVIEC